MMKDNQSIRSQNTAEEEKTKKSVHKYKSVCIN